ncbi:hypothetical protein EDC91_14218 [Shewanella fodinae]|jgi:hypothetical protein|uniref:Uncharacterized protein n=1 Tax=Shewanella fodinae TaxID=552357 RepID=A0A4R2FDK9_9GAMM|nr:hypothetical protein EDC91_14218 [Shewanella fodinae]
MRRVPANPGHHTTTMPSIELAQIYLRNAIAITLFGGHSTPIEML